MPELHCPEYIEAINLLMGELARALMTAGSPLLGAIRHTVVDHLPTADADPEATVGVMHPVKIATTFDLKVEVILTTDVEGWEMMMHEAAQAALAATMPQFFEGMGAAISKVGNVIDAEGRQLDWDLYLDGLEKIEMDFDHSGKPQLPTLVVNPEVAERFKGLPFTEEHKVRFDDIIGRKKVEFDARRRVRQLD